MFRNVLVWFGGLLLFTFIAYVFTSTYLSPRSRFQGEFFRHTLEFQTSEAELIYVQHGAVALSEFLERLDARFPGVHHLLDLQGTDLATGTSRSDLLPRGPRHPGFLTHAPLPLRHATNDGRFMFVVEPLGMNAPWQDISVYGWIVLVVVLLCYVLAWRLAVPIRTLHTAVVRFGQGDLSSRSNIKRRDELGSLSHAFNKMAERIETLLTAERRLLQDVSHELRSPLARLRFAIELARSGNGSTSPAAFDRITKEVDRLATLVDELLQVTRAEGDPGSRNATPIDLPAFLQSLADDCRIEAEARGSRVIVDAGPPVQWTGDRELLHRAVENVVRNAIRHTEPGSAVQIQLIREPNWMIIRVRDHGPGVPEAELPKIFQPFYRVDDSRSRDSGGVGLGLAIATRAMRVHHGDIQASNAHPGLQVELRLPQ